MKVTDFGIAKVMDSGDHLTMTGSLLGTPSYMSPEQARGAALDGRSDLFAVGCILYEMLAGKKAFRGDSITGLIFKIITEEPPPLREMDPDVPEEMVRIIAKCPGQDAGRALPDRARAGRRPAGPDPRRHRRPRCGRRSGHRARLLAAAVDVAPPSITPPTVAPAPRRRGDQRPRPPRQRRPARAACRAPPRPARRAGRRAGAPAPGAAESKHGRDARARRRRACSWSSAAAGTAAGTSSCARPDHGRGHRRRRRAAPGDAELAPEARRRAARGRTPAPRRAAPAPPAPIAAAGAADAPRPRLRTRAARRDRRRPRRRARQAAPTRARRRAPRTAAAKPAPPARVGLRLLDEEAAAGRRPRGGRAPGGHVSRQQGGQTAPAASGPRGRFNARERSPRDLAPAERPAVATIRHLIDRMEAFHRREGRYAGLADLGRPGSPSTFRLGRTPSSAAATGSS